MNAAASPITQRIAPAVEEPHHHVAAVRVGPQEELALPGGPDRRAVQRDHVRLLAVDHDLVGQVVLVRAWSSPPGWPTAGRRGRSPPAGGRGTRRRSPPCCAAAGEPEPPRPDAGTCSRSACSSQAAGPAGRCVLSWRLGGHCTPSEGTLPEREGARCALPWDRYRRLLEAPARVVVGGRPDGIGCSCRSPSAPRGTSPRSRVPYGATYASSTANLSASAACSVAPSAGAASTSSISLFSCGSSTRP